MTKEELLKVAKPILFNTDMVRAILDGRKTVTRRVVKPKSKNACGFYVTFRKSDNAFMGVYDYDENEIQFDNSQTPPCQPGDILYVREAWTDHYVPNEEGKAELQYCYKADGIDIKAECLPGENNRWYPSIHMPKEAARIFLKVMDVRVERLSDMKVEDAIAEGISMAGLVTEQGIIAYRVWNRWNELWNSTIPKKDMERYGSDANPWVWVIEFERYDNPESLCKAGQQSNEDILMPAT